MLPSTTPEPVTTRDAESRLRDLLEQADIHTAGSPARAEELATRALDLARSVHAEEWEARALIVLGWTKLFDGMPQLALGLQKQAMRIAFRADRPAAQARVLNLGGLIHGHFSRFAAALSSFDHALQLVDESTEPKLKARILNNLGTVEMRLGHLAEAEKIFEQAMEIRRGLDDPIGYAVVLNNLACAMLERQRGAASAGGFEAARAKARESIGIAREKGATRLLASVLLTLADIEQAMGLASDSRAATVEALALAQSINDRWMHAFALSILGEVSLLESAPERAEGLLAESLAMFEALSVHAQVSRVSVILSTALEKVGKFADAVRLLRRHLEIEREIKSEESLQQSRFIAERLKFERLLDDAARYQKQLNELEGLNRELERQQADLESAAFTDALTGLPNRRRLDAVLDQRVERERGALAVCVADIDNFKQINDRHGHPVGDRVLAIIAALFKAAIRRDDLVGRLGGEEFVFVLACGGVREAGALLERIRAEVEAYDWSGTVCPGLAVTVSLGYVFVQDGDAGDALRAADNNLYACKRDGKNRIAPAFAV